MSSYPQVSPVSGPATGEAPWARLWSELSALSDALLSPGKIIGQVEEFHALRKQADRLAARDPERAAVLRRRAARALS
jgi:hypothetical protein